MTSTRTEFDHLAAIYLPIALLVFALVCGLVGLAILRSWRRRDRPASQRHSAPRLEATYVVVLIGVVAFLVFETFSTESRVDAVPKPGPVSDLDPSSAAKPGLVVNVTASKWQWRFDYPGLGISQLATPGQLPTLVVPMGTPVEFNLSSVDVIHSFWVPDERFKRDAFPERSTSFELLFNKPGASSGSCAEYCGEGHSGMRFAVDVLAPDGFRRWASEHPRTPGQ